jgi:hypothetical protein
MSISLGVTCGSGDTPYGNVPPWYNLTSVRIKFPEYPGFRSHTRGFDD